MSEGKVRVVMFEMAGSDQVLQEAIRTFQSAIGGGQVVAEKAR